MPRKLIPPEPWWSEAADLMVRCNISLRQAAAELGIDLTIEEADNIKGRKLFQKALDEAKIAYYNQIGSNPRLSNTGAMLSYVQDVEASEWIEQIRATLTASPERYGFDLVPGLVKESLTVYLVATHRSHHDRARLGRPIAIYHSFLQF